MNKISLFTDGSLNPHSKIGFGAYIIQKYEKVSKVVVKKFESTSSTKLELETFLWAIKEIIDEDFSHLVIYTDSQNIVTLPARREKLESNDFKNLKGVVLKNSNIYREFFILLDQLDFEIIKVSGHLKSKNKDSIDRIFTLVDRGSRKALKNFMNKSQSNT